MLGLGFYLFAIRLIIVDIDAANILACLSSPSQSHHIIETTILEELANRGHNVNFTHFFKCQFQFSSDVYIDFYSISNLNFYSISNTGDSAEHISSAGEDIAEAIPSHLHPSR